MFLCIIIIRKVIYGNNLELYFMLVSWGNFAGTNQRGQLGSEGGSWHPPILPRNWVASLL